MCRFLASFCLLIICTPAISQGDSGCECKRTPRIWKDYNRSKAVFVGTVVEEFDDHLRLRVNEAWKGVSMGDWYVEVVRRSPEKCGYVFDQPRTYYMIFAYEDESAGTEALWVSQCSRTRPSADANRDQQVMGRPKWVRFGSPPPPDPSD